MDNFGDKIGTNFRGSFRDIYGDNFEDIDNNCAAYGAERPFSLVKRTI